MLNTKKNGIIYFQANNLGSKLLLRTAICAKHWFLTRSYLTKVIDSFDYILHFALIASEQIYNAFVIAVKTMINNILFLVN